MCDSEAKPRQHSVVIRQRNRTYKIIVIGESSVGKSSLIRRLCEGTFSEAGISATTCMEVKTHTLNIDGENITLQIWDTMGMERYRSIMRSYYMKSDAVILVYDIRCLTSFYKIGEWMGECDRYCSEGILRMLIGNKSDSEAQVPTKIAQEFANRFSIPLFLTSAKENSQDSIDAAFLTLGRLLKDRTPLSTKSAAILTLTEPKPDIKTEKGCCG